MSSESLNLLIRLFNLLTLQLFFISQKLQHMFITRLSIPSSQIGFPFKNIHPLFLILSIILCYFD